MPSDVMDDGFQCEAICSCRTIYFKVRYRRKDEDLLEWMEGVVRPAMGKAHSEQSPLCTATAADLKMPIPDGSPGIGMRVVS